jgi:hypothetical protein
MWSATRLGRRSAAPPRRRLHRATRARLHAPHTPHTACVEAHLQTHSARLKLLRATDVYTPFVQPTAPVESATSGPNREPSTQKSNQKSNGCQSVRQWLSFLSLRTVVRAQRSYEPCYDITVGIRDSVVQLVSTLVRHHSTSRARLHHCVGRNERVRMQ